MDWKKVYDFWFPAELARGELSFQLRMSDWWMKGGATPELPPFAPYVEAAVAGDLDHWTETALGRLCLIIVLDQFPRGLLAGSARAYAYDPVALRLCEEGLANGQIYELGSPFEQFFFTLPMVHAEGPDHLERLHRLLVANEEALPELVRRFPALQPIFEFSIGQIASNIEVIQRFGRFPHRIAVLGRPSTDEERVYIDSGDFVHLRRPEG
jgi:uncharacterized protein (DUF924 family)